MKDVISGGSLPQPVVAPWTDKGICVVGPQRFQNELLAYFLERETGLECETKASIRHIALVDDEESRLQRQILWDCLGKDSATVVAEIESGGKGVLAGNLVALFNVGVDLGIEEQTVPLGVRGFLYEGDSLELLLKGVQAIFEGELWLSRGKMTKLILDRRREPLPWGEGVVLTHRQAEILGTLATGYTNDEIATRLCVSPHTVKTHIYNIFKKINVQNRLEAALWAAKNL